MSSTLDPASRQRPFPRVNNNPPALAGSGNGEGRLGISKLTLDREGLVTAVLWQTLDAVTSEDAAFESVVPVRAVVAAIRNGRRVVALFPTMPPDVPERRFVVIEQGSRGATVALDGSPSPGRDISDLYMFCLEGTGRRADRWPGSGAASSEHGPASPVSSQTGP